MECVALQNYSHAYLDMGCCRCNMVGSCKGCVCVKEGRSCSNCLRPPGQMLQQCRLRHPDAPHSLPVPPAACSTLPLHPLPPATPVAGVPSNAIDAVALPNLDLVLCLRVPTLQKAVRDSWAHIVGDVLSAITPF